MTTVRGSEREASHNGASIVPRNRNKLRHVHEEETKRNKKLFTESLSQSTSAVNSLYAKLSSRKFAILMTMDFTLSYNKGGGAKD